jgi:hypothetical protein
MTMAHTRGPRPSAFTIFGVVNLVIGAFSAITVPVVVLAMLKTAIAPEDHRIVIDRTYQSLVVAVGCLRIVLPALMLGSGVALLRGRVGGRWLAVAWIVLVVVELGLSSYLDWETVITPVLEHTELRDPGAAPNLAESLGTVIGRGVFVLGYAGFVARFLFFNESVRRYLSGK